MSSEFSSASGSSSTCNMSFTTASALKSVDVTCITSSSNAIDQFKINETIRIRERLAQLNSKDLWHYFKGIRKLYDELLAKKEEYEMEVIMHQEKTKQYKQDLQRLQKEILNVQQDVSKENIQSSAMFNEVLYSLEENAPELAEKTENLHQMQRKLAYLKFTRNFIILRDEVRRYLRKGNYTQLLDNYRKLMKIPMDNPDYSIDELCRREYNVKSASLAQFLHLELLSSLNNLFSRIQFPFEEPVDFDNLRLPLSQSAQILKCLNLVNFKNTPIIGSTITGCGSPEGTVMIILEEFTKRFDYHFYGDRPTNNPSKPEWFFTQLSYWAENNIEYFEQHIQPFIEEMCPEINIKYKSAKDMFLQHLMWLASQKVADILQTTGNILEDQNQLSHLIDESVLFEKEMQESFGYHEEAPIHVVSELCKVNSVLETWIRLERDTLSAGIDAILADEEAYEPRYREAADVDPYLVPNFADAFVILIQSMSDRYRSIPETRVQCRFLKLQLVVVDEFRSRIVQIWQHLQHNPWEKPYPQLMNALWYLTLVLDDWSDSPEYVQLQFFLQQHQSLAPTHHATTSTSNQSVNIVNSLARGTFDDSASLYRHVWRQKVRNLCDSFSEELRKKLGPYANEKWYAMEAMGSRCNEVTPSLESFLRKLQELLGWITTNISSDSVLTLHHLTNHELWNVLDECVMSQTAFTYQGAAQLLFDCTTAIIPLLNSCYSKVKEASEFDVFNEKCIHVLNTLRLLALPPPMAILLKDELKHIPEQQLNEKLEQFNISGMSKARVTEVLEQRCDLLPLEKLIS